MSISPHHCVVVAAHPLSWEYHPHPWVFTRAPKACLIYLRDEKSKIRWGKTQQQQQKNKAFLPGSFSFWSFLELSSRLLLSSCTWFFLLIMRVSWSHILPTVDLFFLSELVKKFRKQKQQPTQLFCHSVLLFFLLSVSLSIVFCYY